MRSHLALAVYLSERLDLRSFAFIFGNEVKGVQQEAINASENCIEIPQFGTKHSFNIAVTVGIVLWQAAFPLLKELQR